MAECTDLTITTITSTIHTDTTTTTTTTTPTITNLVDIVEFEVLRRLCLCIVLFIIKWERERRRGTSNYDKNSHITTFHNRTSDRSGGNIYRL